MKKICVVTGSRAEYGLIKPVLEIIKKSPELKLQLIVTGTHLSSKFGYTVKIVIIVPLGSIIVRAEFGSRLVPKTRQSQRRHITPASC